MPRRLRRRRPRDGEYYCFLETFGGGYGGRARERRAGRGADTRQNTENAPVEETELNYPVRVTRLSLVDDSEGPGRFRGGLGLRKDFLFDRPTTFTVLADRTQRGPGGVFGGLAGRRRGVRAVRGGEERGSARRRRSSWKRATSSATGPAAAAATARRRSATRARGARRARGQGQRRAAREIYGSSVASPAARSNEVRRRALRVTQRRPDHVRGDPQRARRGDGRDGAGAEAQRVLDEHQDALRLLVRVLRRRAASVAQGFAQPVHLGSMVEQVPTRFAATAPRTSARATRSSATIRIRAACT